MNKVALIKFAVLALLILVVEDVFAECNKKCKKIKRSAVIGVLQDREYLQESRDMLVVKNKAIAINMGYAPFAGCSSDTSVAAKAAKCAPVVLSTRDGIYYCPNQVKPFKNISKAENKGFTSYTGCGTLEPLPAPTPTPTPTPSVPPLVSTFSVTLEDGTRFSDVDAGRVLKLNSGSYRAYTSPSTDSFVPDTIYYSDSADGVTFGARVAISGIAPASSVETFAFPSVVQLADNSFSMIYEKSRHISSAAVDLNSLMRAVSANGAAFSNSPATIVISNGSVISSHFSPDVIKLNDTTHRMYYYFFGRINEVESTDNGATWDEEGEVAILGNSDSFAPFPIEPSVVKLADDNFLMFVVSQATTDNFDYSLYAAQSNDGLTFTLYDQPLATPPADSSIFSPSAVKLGDGSIRVYYLQRSGAFDTSVRLMKSLIYDP